MQLGPTAVAARNSTVPARGAEQAQSQPVPYAELADRLATHGPAVFHSELHRLVRVARRLGVTPLLVTIPSTPPNPTSPGSERSDGFSPSSSAHTRRGPTRRAPHAMRAQRQ